MRSLLSCCFTILLFTISGLWPASASVAVTPESPKVVVSITPFYALVADLMEGVGTPILLVQPGASPHQYALRPSDLQRLAEADLIFWAGPTLETFLVKPLGNLPPSKKIIVLEKTPQLLLLPVRQEPAWEPHAHTDDTAHTDEHSTDHDMHFWLDPHNAVILTDAIVQNLVQTDPKHADIYKKNGENLKTRLRALDIHIAQKLADVQNIPYLVFHDAYQYFEHRYHLNAVGSITLHPELPPSAKRLTIIRGILEKTKARCVFTEPQFQSKLVHSIIQDLPVKIGELDPIGQATQDNPEGYFVLLENLADSMKNCLAPAHP